jgi:hypothetical protein
MQERNSEERDVMQSEGKKIKKILFLVRGKKIQTRNVIN